jgi:hypothetical protein
MQTALAGINAARAGCSPTPLRMGIHPGPAIRVVDDTTMRGRSKPIQLLAPARAAA